MAKLSLPCHVPVISIGYRSCGMNGIFLLELIYAARGMP
jgi:hypothetical protein